MSKQVPVLITTDKDKRGVFMGLVDPKDFDSHKDGDSILAEEVRMCVRWDYDDKGVIGLAANGPCDKARITAAAPKAKIHGVTALFELSAKSLKRWRKEPWGN
jgi:hypothetical protein